MVCSTKNGHLGLWIQGETAERLQICRFLQCYYAVLTGKYVSGKRMAVTLKVLD